MADLVKSGMIDDFRFASLWAAARTRRKAESPYSLIIQLQRRGIERRTAENAVHGALDLAQEVQLLELYLHKYPEKSNSKKALQKEGFSSSAVETWADNTAQVKTSV